MIRTWVVILLLGSWFSLTFLFQLFMRRLTRHVRRYDVFGIIVGYHFFSGRSRYLVLAYRDRLTDGTFTAWQEVQFHRQQTLSTLIWNPQLFMSSVVLTLLKKIATLVENKKFINAVKNQNTSAYEAILAYLTHQRSPDNFSARQFQIWESDGHFSKGPRKVIFTSLFHDLS
jgi:hypothetical protein